VRVAALYDVHGNLPALEAVLEEVEALEVDAVVVGGDVAIGPMPRRSLERLLALGERALFLRGNGDREIAAVSPGTGSGLWAERTRWSAEQIERGQLAWLAALPDTRTVDVDGLGRVLFCHGSPRSDEEIVTQATPDRHLRKVLSRAKESVVVAGHTHMQLDRRVDGFRWVNAGSVGMPYEGEVAAFWALLGPDVELRRTACDVERTVEDVFASGWPDAETFVEKNLRTAVGREDVVPVFEGFAIDRGER